MLEVLVLIGVVGLVVMLSVAGIGAWIVVRGAQRARRHAGRVVTDLRLRANTRPGQPGRDIARLRCDLRESLRRGRAVLGAPAVVSATATATVWSDDGPALLREAAALDAHLALIEREPDRATRASVLTALTPRVEQVIADCAALRRAAYCLTVEFDPPGARLIRAERRDRLDGWASAVRELSPAPVPGAATRRRRSR